MNGPVRALALVLGALMMLLPLIMLALGCGYGADDFQILGCKSSLLMVPMNARTNA